MCLLTNKTQEKYYYSNVYDNYFICDPIYLYTTNFNFAVFSL